MSKYRGKQKEKNIRIKEIDLSDEFKGFFSEFRNYRVNQRQESENNNTRELNERRAIVSSTPQNVEPSLYNEYQGYSNGTIYPDEFACFNNSSLPAQSIWQPEYNLIWNREPADSFAFREINGPAISGRDQER